MKILVTCIMIYSPVFSLEKAEAAVQPDFTWVIKCLKVK